MDRLEPSSARTPGSASATATWRRTSWRTDRLRDGERPTEVALALQQAIGHPPRDPADGRRAGPDRGPDRRRLARVPGVLRPPPPGAGGPRGPVPRRRGGARRRPRSVAAIEAADVVVIAPSNPIVSIGPILAVAGDAGAARGGPRRGSPVVAVSGIVGGNALKGPADRMLASLGHEARRAGVAAAVPRPRRCVRARHRRRRPRARDRRASGFEPS